MTKKRKGGFRVKDLGKGIREQEEKTQSIDDGEGGGGGGTFVHSNLERRKKKNVDARVVFH